MDQNGVTEFGKYHAKLQATNPVNRAYLPSDSSARYPEVEGWTFYKFEPWMKEFISLQFEHMYEVGGRVYRLLKFDQFVAHREVRL